MVWDEVELFRPSASHFKLFESYVCRTHFYFRRFLFQIVSKTHGFVCVMHTLNELSNCKHEILLADEILKIRSFRQQFFHSIYFIAFLRLFPIQMIFYNQRWHFFIIQKNSKDRELEIEVNFAETIKGWRSNKCKIIQCDSYLLCV